MSTRPRLCNSDYQVLTAPYKDSNDPWHALTDAYPDEEFISVWSQGMNTRFPHAAGIVRKADRGPQGLKDTLRASLEFISGFEDDETQEGIPELLKALRESLNDLHQHTPKNELMIHLRGGVIQGISADRPEELSTVTILDYDIEGLTEEELQECVSVIDLEDLSEEKADSYFHEVGPHLYRIE